MAICFRKIFKSSCSVLLTARGNRQTNTLSCKTFSSSMTFSKEKTIFEYSPSGRSHACNFGSSLPFDSNSSTMIEDTHDFCNKKKIGFEYLNNSNLEYIRLREIVYYIKECKAYKEEDHKDVNYLGKAEPEQVLHVFNVLSHDLPRLFNYSLNYSIYHKNIIFENNIRGTTTKGLFGYINQITLLKTIGHIKFARVKFDILKITAHPEDGTVRVRWRIRGVPNLKAFMSFLRSVSPFKPIELEGWFDGFSVFYVRSDGLVHKHTVDKMIPDSNEKVTNFQNNLAAKIAVSLGIMIKGMHDGLSTVIYVDISGNKEGASDILWQLQDLNPFFKEETQN